MKEFCDLQDVDFRKLLILNLRTHLFCDYYHIAEILKEEGEFTYNSMLRFYFECSKDKYMALTHYIEYAILETRFDYKMNKINYNRLAIFFQIVKEKTGVLLTARTKYWLLNKIMAMHSIDTGNPMITPDEIYELADIFLDQI